jgi:hypothetical protein
VDECKPLPDAGHGALQLRANQLRQVGPLAVDQGLTLVLCSAQLEPFLTPKINPNHHIMGPDTS